MGARIAAGRRFFTVVSDRRFLSGLLIHTPSTASSSPGRDSATMTLSFQASAGRRKCVSEYRGASRHDADALIVPRYCHISTIFSADNVNSHYRPLGTAGTRQQECRRHMYITATPGICFHARHHHSHKPRAPLQHDTRALGQV